MVSLVPETQTDVTGSNWLGWSKPVGTPVPDRGKEVALKTLGEGLKDAAEVGGSIVKQGTAAGARDLLDDQIQNTQVAAIQTAQSLLQNQQPGQDTPPEVANAKTITENLGSSKANGAISNTYYLGKLLAYQKDLRSQFPMYSNQIDEGVRQATGVAHTANEYYNSLLRDLNSYLTKKDSRENQALQEAHQVWGAPGVRESAQRYLNNKTPQNLEALENITAKVQSRGWQIKQLTGEYQLDKEMKDFNSAQAERVWTAEANNYVATYADQVAKELGYDSYASIEDAFAHPEAHAEVDIQKIAHDHELLGTRLRAGLNQLANRRIAYTDQRTGKPQYADSYAQQIPDKYQNVIDNALKSHAAYSSMIRDKEFGPVGFLSRMDKAASDDIIHQLLADKMGIQTPSTVIKWMKDQGMDKFAQSLMEDQLKAGGMVDKTKAFMLSTRARSTLTPSQAAAGGIKPADSMQDDIDGWVNKLGYTSPNTIHRFIDDLVDIHNKDLPDQNKAAKILYAFGPKNTHVLNTWQVNGIQPDGTVSNKPDRWNVFATMTAPEITKEIRRLDAKFPKLQLWDNYKSTTSTMIHEMIGKQAHDLDKLAYSPTRGDIIYDNETHQFQYMPVGGTLATNVYPGVGGVKGVAQGPEQRLISQMNLGLARIADIAKAEGSNVDSTIYQHLKSLGYDFVDHPDTAGKGLMNALTGTMLAEKNAHEQERKRIEELNQKKKDNK